MAREVGQTPSEWLPAELLAEQDEVPAEQDEVPAERGWVPAGRGWVPAGRGEAPQYADESTDSTESPAELEDLTGIHVDADSEPEAVELHEQIYVEQARPPKLHWGPIRPVDRGSSALDLNAVTFEQLSRLGLSFHQAAGIIGRREQRGGFTSPDELDQLAGVYGLRRDQIAALKQAAGA